MVNIKFLHKMHFSRMRWPRDLRRRSAASRLLGLRVRTPLRYESLFVVNGVCCLVEVTAKGRSLVQSSPTV